MDYSLARYFDEAKIAEYPEWFSDVILRHPDIPDFAPDWHQITGLNLQFIHSRSALYDEQGTGKTLQAQAAMIWHAAMGSRALAMMPPGLLLQFEKSFYTTFENMEKYVHVEQYYGTPREREAMAQHWKEHPPQIVLTSIDMFREEFKIFDHFDICALWCDECKYWANPETKIGYALRWYLGEYGKRNIVGLHGTPAKNNLADLYGYIDLVTPWVYSSKADFYRQHVIEGVRKVRFKKNGELVEKEIRVIDGFKNTEKLRSNLYLQARRVEKDKTKLPKKMIVEREYRLTGKHGDSYSRFANALCLTLPSGKFLSGEQSATARQIARQGIFRPDIFEVDEIPEGIRQIEQLLDELDVEHNKIMIGCFYRETVERLAEYFKQYKPAVMYGGQSAKKSMLEGERFKEAKDCRIAVMNIESAGAGYNFQHSRYSITAEPTTVPGDYDQWIDRQHRRGQKDDVTNYILIPRRTVFVRDVQVMRRKKIVNSEVVDNDTLRSELLGE